MRRIFSIGLLALGLAACSKEGPQSGPVVAKGKGFEITAGEFKARIEEQSPFMRARYNNLDRKKEFLDSLVRFEVLAAEAKRQGLDKDADVQLMVKRFMVNKLVQKNMSDQGKDPAAVVPDAEAQKYYDDHISEYQRPKRVHLSEVVFNSEPGTPKRTKDLASAKRALAQLKVDEKKTPMAFNGIVNSYSEDPNKAQGGDLGFKSADELTQAFSPALAKAAMELGNGQTSSAIETPKGVYLIRNLGQQDAMNRGFDQVKSQIVAKLARDKHQTEFEEWLKKLKDDAGVQTNDKDLDAIVISTGLPQAPGMPGMQPGMPPGHPGMPGQPGMPGGHPPMMPNPQGPMSAPASK